MTFRRIFLISTPFLVAAMIAGLVWSFGPNSEEGSSGADLVSAEGSRSLTAATLADHLVISEIQIGDADSAAHDFVEIYNPTDSPIDLSDYEGGYIKLIKRTKSGTSDSSVKSWKNPEEGENSIVPAHGYYLWASKNAGDGWELLVGADTSTSTTLANNNAVGLRFIKTDNQDEPLIDSVGWGEAENSLVEREPAPTPPEYGSIERKSGDGLDHAYGNALDTDDNSWDFMKQYAPNPQNSESMPLAPVPELPTLALFAIGLCTIGLVYAYGRRRQTSAIII
ncbi:MAG: lamin tail domain-containing protein [Chloroflexota bacterium]|nr:lamin tail domain-containing protein [Chloroflexota bacterium]